MLAQVYCYVMSVFIKLILLSVLLSIPNSEADAFIPVLLLLLKESSYFFFFIIFLCAWVCMFVWMSSYMYMCKGKQKTTAGLIPQAWYIFFYSRDSDMWNSSRIQGWESASTKDLLTPSSPPWDCSYVSPFLVSMVAWRLNSDHPTSKVSISLIEISPNSLEKFPILFSNEFYWINIQFGDFIHM